ncbi:hypothetical protein POM88_033054 [Heracleum sosnowskyi]|uniref:F-box domain-containing protein n=1 Tax=Heracleum sosnowskyi TaxID=360622 RepID=A0AAD8MKP2_9APIA|nr:hypothetical protein POM88_033054 [Heracleum sosnowskyi]
MADFLTKDILAEILKRLSVKSLLQVRCTKKSWYHLIQSPDFISLHSDYQRNAENKYLLFQGRYRSCFSLRFDDKQCNAYPTLLSLPIPKNVEKGSSISVNIHGTTRGLICFSLSAFSPCVQQTYLWNPIVRIAKPLPDSPVPSHATSSMLFGLAFGYFPDINDYKVIKIEGIFVERSRFYTVYIYSLSTDFWITVPVNNDIQFHSYDQLYNSISVNGAAYWIGIKKPVFMQVVVRFDMENETVGEIKIPPQYAFDSSQRHISSFNLVQHFGEVVLSVVYIDRSTDTFIHDILVLEKDAEMNEVWMKKVTIDLNKVGQNWWPVGFRNNGEIVLINYDYDDERGFLSYNHEKEEATEIVDEPDNPGHVWYYADFEDPDNPRYDYGYCGPFAYHASDMQPMFVDSFEENLVLLGDTTLKDQRNSRN